MYSWYLWAKFLLVNIAGLLLTAVIYSFGLLSPFFEPELIIFSLSIVIIFAYTLYHTTVKTYKVSQTMNEIKNGSGDRYNEFLKMARKSVDMAIYVTRDKMINKIEWVRTGYMIIFMLGASSVFYSFIVSNSFDFSSLFLANLLAIWTYFNYEILKNGVSQLVSAIAKKYSE